MEPGKTLRDIPDHRYQRDLGGIAGHTHQYGPWWQLGLRTSMWLLAAAQSLSIWMALSGNLCRGHQPGLWPQDHWCTLGLQLQHGLWTSLWPWATAWTTLSNVTPRGHRWPQAGHVWGLSLHLFNLQAVAHCPADPTGQQDVLLLTSVISHTSHSCWVSLQFSLSSQHAYRSGFFL